MVVDGTSCQFMVVHGNTWQLMVVCGSSWQFNLLGCQQLEGKGLWMVHFIVTDC
jgi:hypothetical protein